LESIPQPKETKFQTNC